MHIVQQSRNSADGQVSHWDRRSVEETEELHNPLEPLDLFAAVVHEMVPPE